MSKISFDNWLCRASSFSKLLVEPKLKVDKDAGKFGKTAETYLRKVYREVKYNRHEEFESKHTKKGKSKEYQAIDIVSIVTKEFYKKNTIRLNNHFTTGEPDIFVGNDIKKCEIGGDVKCSWSLFTFPYKDEKLDPNYEWQNKVYMYLTGAKEWYTHYCLVNAPDTLILNEKKGVWYNLDCPEDEEHPLYEEYIEKCCNIERNMIFDMPQFKKDHPYFNLDTKDWKYDISMEERVVSFKVERNKEDEEKIKEVVTKARKYLNDLNDII